MDDNVMIRVQPDRYGYRVGDTWRPTFGLAKKQADTIVTNFEKLGYRKIRPGRKTVKIDIEAATIARILAEDDAKHGRRRDKHGRVKERQRQREKLGIGWLLSRPGFWWFGLITILVITGG